MVKTTFYQSLIFLLLSLIVIPATFTVSSSNQTTNLQHPFEPYLVKNIATGTVDAHPHSLIQLNGVTYFGAQDEQGNSGLWRSDGSEAGTWFIKQIGSATNSIRKPVILNDTLYFIGSATTGGFDLWHSDGTTEGTVIIKEDVESDNLVVVQNKLFFIVTNENHNDELWHSDGSSEGTMLFLDLATTPRSLQLNDLAALDEKLFFAASRSDLDQLELWISDGTPSGSQPIHTFDNAPTIIRNHAIHLGKLFLQIHNENRIDLWLTDGTSNGTFFVKQIADDLDLRGEMVSFGDTLYFQGHTVEHGNELWQSDGTSGGTFMLKDINSGPESSWPTLFTSFSSTHFFFSANTPTHGDELWASDGTSNGTQLVADLVPGEGSSSPIALSTFDEKAIFSMLNVSGVWESDGSTAGTSLLTDKVARAGEFQVFNDGFLFQGLSQENGSELWQSDGTSNNTTLVKDINLKSQSASPDHLTRFQEQLFFTANSNSIEPIYGLWKTDGHEMNTILLTEALTGQRFHSLTVAGDSLFFFNDSALWQSDGTVTGTAVLKNFGNNSHTLSPRNLNGTLYFVRTNPSPSNQDIQLWRSDGTEAGTELITSLAGSPYDVTVLGNHLYFIIEGEQLWRSDGTAAGTIQLENPQGSNRYGAMLEALEQLFFIYDNNLWRLSPNTNDMEMVLADASYILLSGATILNNRLFFTSCCANGLQLWQSDGTMTGTTLVETIQESPTPGHNFSSDLKTVNNHFYFFTFETEETEALWQSNGTAVGTKIITTFQQGHTLGINQLTVSDHYLYFAIRDGQHGNQLWQSNGSAAGTVRLTDFPLDHAPFAYLTDVNSQLFFSVDDGATGKELWALQPPNFTQQIYLPVIQQ